ncbi:hypothetical protein LSH36_231g02038 [Paralvinella palmiformis]|uniref:EGF-like domain-containing protein n=1 Tax=Paralvinella palmiformis TaxID=53620 RepID=A0AAD9JPL6_9ANNE|nr:hypothetical protein LSH36_231g02038 [Paralvinella palmiformis]
MANLNKRRTPTTTSTVSSGGLAVKYPALGANGRRFEPHESCHPVVSEKFFCYESNVEMDVIWTCDEVLDCTDPNDEDPEVCNNITCPQDPCSSMPCLNGGTCNRITDFDYQCICPDGFDGDNCSAINTVTVGVVSAVGGVTAANTGCMVYAWYKDVKKKADALKAKAAKLKKKAKSVKNVAAKKGTGNNEETKRLLDKTDIESQKSPGLNRPITISNRQPPV